MALPPTAAKFSTDISNVTTFFFNFPNFTGSHSGVTATLGINSVAGGGTGLATLTANNVILGNGTSSPTFVAPGTSGNVLTSNGTTWVSSPASSGGTVTSVALADGSTIPIFAISGSPITSSGTLTETLVTQSANKIFAGPTSGAAAQPTFRSLVNADLPSGSSAFTSYVSSKVTTEDTGISSGTFTTFSNSPAFTFTPTITGTYKVYCSIPIQTGTNNEGAAIRIYNTSGSATLLAESQGLTQVNAIGGLNDLITTVTCQSTYTLTAGTSYQFDIQAAVVIGSGTVNNRGDFTPFYMFAEGIALSGTFLTPVGNWKNDLTFTSNGLGTLVSPDFRYRIVGDSLEVVAVFATGTVTASTAAIILPTGYVIDNTKLSTNSSGTQVGEGARQVTGPSNISANGYSQFVFYDGSTTDRVFLTDTSTSNGFAKLNGNSLYGNGEVIDLKFLIPIVGLNGTSLTPNQIAIGTPQTSNVTTTSTTYASFSTPITLSFTATASVKYRIYAYASGSNTNIGQSNFIKIVATSGSPTINQNNVAFWLEPNTGGFYEHVCSEAIVTLTSGTSYTFELQGRTTGGTLTLAAGTLATEGNGIAIIAEQIG